MNWVLINIILGFVCAIIYIINMSSQWRSSSTALAWLLIIFFFPVLGVPLYLVFAGRKLKGIMQKKAYLFSASKVSTRCHPNAVEKILAYYHIPATTEQNSMSIIATGENAYLQLTELIKKASKSIDIQTYILGKDAVADAILALLVQKAKEGVKVRLLLDGLYAFLYSKKKLKHLQQLGIECELFLPLRFRLFRSRINLRNHRKLIIVDDQYAMMGGMNLAKNYMGPNQNEKRWCDIALRLEGEAIPQLLNLFESDWAFAKGKSDGALRQLSVNPKCSDNQAKTSVQVVASGPDVKGDPFHSSLLTALYEAKHSIDIVTPYFVPDNSLVKALSLAVFRGAKVTIIIPRHSNHPVADFARSRHIRLLASAGVKILFFEATMLHAKVITVDDSIAIVGSANFDMRSLFFNFEACVYLYSAESISQICRWITELTFRCSDKRYLANPTPIRQFLENLALLIAPLL